MLSSQLGAEDKEHISKLSFPEDCISFVFFLPSQFSALDFGSSCSRWNFTLSPHYFVYFSDMMFVFEGERALTWIDYLMDGLLTVDHLKG